MNRIRSNRVSGRGVLRRVVKSFMARSLVLSLMLACAGCGSSASVGERAGVQGDVTLDGKPLGAAVISFHGGEGKGKVVAVGLVENGKYAIDAKRGPLVGQARVEVRAKPITEAQFDVAVTEAARRGTRPKLVVMEIPAKYGAKSTLTADVTATGENKFDFNLKSRP